MRRTLLSLIAISSMIAGPAPAQEAAEGRPPSHCIALAEDTSGVTTSFRPPRFLNVSGM